MLAERETLIAVLKNTRDGTSSDIRSICMDARVPQAEVLETLNRLHETGLLRLDGDRVIASGEQRLKLAIRSINLGSDVERVARFLTWSEFEQFSRESLELNGFKVIMNFRFRWFGKRWEIDLIGVKKPLVISADCKHWRRGWSGSASAEAARDQVERTRALADVSRRIRGKLGIGGWEHAYFVPVVLSLYPSQYKFHEKTPIVPILQINDFLQNLIVHLGEVAHFYIQYV
ncbi:MAG: hypothetical protein QXJ19_02440 [Candidatus Bathyarchaeia archaeon]|nr:hypothetical protein [Candidatus Bathyarchaeota archaeon]